MNLEERLENLGFVSDEEKAKVIRMLQDVPPENLLKLQKMARARRKNTLGKLLESLGKDLPEHVRRGAEIIAELEYERVFSLDGVDGVKFVLELHEHTYSTGDWSLYAEVSAEMDGTRMELAEVEIASSQQPIPERIYRTSGKKRSSGNCLGHRDNRRFEL